MITKTIILCKDKAAYDALSALFPTVSGVGIGVRPPCQNGGYLVHHLFNEEDITALQQQLAPQIASGDIVFTDTEPTDWVPASDTP